MQYFGQLYRQVNPEYSPVVSGDAASKLFMRSGLSPVVLGNIWQMADTDNNGYLDQQGFSKALRLIGHVQNGRSLFPSLADNRKLVLTFSAS